MNKYKFRYGGYWNMTVTVKAKNQEAADLKARGELDRRYGKAGKEPPVGWTLILESVT